MVSKKLPEISLFNIDITYKYVTRSSRNLFCKSFSSLDEKETQNNKVKIFIDVMTSPAGSFGDLGRCKKWHEIVVLNVARKVFCRVVLQRIKMGLDV